MSKSGGWTGGVANYVWSRGRRHDGSEVREVLRVLAEFRTAHGWQPGMVWNPYKGAYERSKQHA